MLMPAASGSARSGRKPAERVEQRDTPTTGAPAVTGSAVMRPHQSSAAAGQHQRPSGRPAVRTAPCWPRPGLRSTAGPFEKTGSDQLANRRMAIATSGIATNTIPAIAGRYTQRGQIRRRVHRQGPRARLIQDPPTCRSGHHGHELPGQSGGVPLTPRWRRH